MQISLKKFKIFGTGASLLILGIFLICCSFFLGNSRALPDLNSAQSHFDGTNPPQCCFVHSQTHQTVHNIIKSAITPLTQQSTNAITAFLAFGALAFLGYSFYRKIKPVLALGYYFIQHRSTNFYNYLIQAFARGILQPQIYNA